MQDVLLTLAESGGLLEVAAAVCPESGLLSSKLTSSSRRSFIISDVIHETTVQYDEISPNLKRKNI